MQPEENLDLANGLHLRVLVRDDAGLLVEATSEEQDPALWGPRPAGPYSLRDAQAALSAWDPAAGGQFSIGILHGRHLLGAVGLMPDRPGSAELAYWVRPGQRGRGIAAQAVRATTPWAHRSLGIPRIWLEINPATSRRFGSHGGPATASNSVFPGTAATGPVRMPNTTHGTTASSGPT
jgi:RimJ/RimL family protein N-acetyltransferase